MTLGETVSRIHAELAGERRKIEALAREATKFGDLTALRAAEAAEKALQARKAVLLNELLTDCIDALRLDVRSAASRQHFMTTGEYLREGERP